MANDYSKYGLVPINEERDYSKYGLVPIEQEEQAEQPQQPTNPQIRLPNAMQNGPLGGAFTGLANIPSTLYGEPIQFASNFINKHTSPAAREFAGHLSGIGPLGPAVLQSLSEAAKYLPKIANPESPTMGYNISHTTTDLAPLLAGGIKLLPLGYEAVTKGIPYLIKNAPYLIKNAGKIAGKVLPSKETIKDILFRLKNNPEAISQQAIKEFPVGEYAQRPSAGAAKELIGQVPEEHFNPQMPEELQLPKGLRAQQSPITPNAPNVPKEFEEYKRLLNPENAPPERIGQETAKNIKKNYEVHREKASEMLNPVYEETKNHPMFEIGSKMSKQTHDDLRYLKTILSPEVSDAFIDMPDAKNVAEAITEIGHDIGDLNRLKFRQGYLDTAPRHELRKLKAVYNRLKNIRTNFIEKNYPHLKAPLKKGLDYFREKVVQYYKTPAIRNFVTGKVTNPKNIETEIEYSEPHIKKIISELGNEGKNKILASHLYNDLFNPAKPPTAENLNTSLFKLQKAGLASYQPPGTKQAGMKAVEALRNQELNQAKLLERQKLIQTRSLEKQKLNQVNAQKTYKAKQDLADMLKEAKSSEDPQVLIDMFKKMEKQKLTGALPDEFKKGIETLNSMVEKEKPYNEIATQMQKLKLGKNVKPSEVSTTLERFYRENLGDLLPASTRTHYENLLRSERGGAKFKTGLKHVGMGGGATLTSYLLHKMGLY
jgi:hypothetical protein